MLAAIRAGMDPGLAASETRKIQAEILAATAVIEQWERSEGRTIPLSEERVRDALSGAEQLVRLLAGADRIDRAELYAALGVRLRYERDAATGLERVQARLQLRSSGGRI